MKRILVTGAAFLAATIVVWWTVNAPNGPQGAIDGADQASGRESALARTTSHDATVPSATSSGHQLRHGALRRPVATSSPGPMAASLESTAAHQDLFEDHQRYLESLMTQSQAAMAMTALQDYCDNLIAAAGKKYEVMVQRVLAGELRDWAAFKGDFGEHVEIENQHSRDLMFELGSSADGFDPEVAFSEAGMNYFNAWCESQPDPPVAFRNIAAWMWRRRGA